MATITNFGEALRIQLRTEKLDFVYYEGHMYIAIFCEVLLGTELDSKKKRCLAKWFGSALV